MTRDSKRYLYSAHQSMFLTMGSKVWCFDISELQVIIQSSGSAMSSRLLFRGLTEDTLLKEWCMGDGFDCYDATS